MAYPQISFIQTVFPQGSFIAKKRLVIWQNTILYQLNELKKTGRYDAFELKWKDIYKSNPNQWPVSGHLFWDSDIAKWIEGACYFLHENSNTEIENAVHELVDMISSAQQPDGYLNIHFTVVDPKGRFTDFRDMHELYNAGHLIEASLAHYHRFNNKKLLQPILNYVDLLSKTLGPSESQKHGYPGHPEIELALLRLYSVTKNHKHFELARYFITERGNPTGQDGRHFYDVEAEERGEKLYERPRYFPVPRNYSYQQAHKPLLEQDTIEGHSVRATYLLTALADLVYKTPNTSMDNYKEALLRLWANMVQKKMYLTGGIGAIRQWEGFGIEYFLPQSLDEGGCYAETCAAIGVVLLAERLLQIDLRGEYGDVMELSFYNALLCGMSCDGERFTYVNQLASSQSDLSERAEWFSCACCPPNVTRLLGCIGGYIWSFNVDKAQLSADVRIHMFSSAILTIPLDGDRKVIVKQTTEWPWKGDITFEIDMPEGASVSLAIRIPVWASDWTIDLVKNLDLKPKDGYLYLEAGLIESNPKFTLKIPIKPRLISPHPYANQDVVALARGPIVYCIEDIDNKWVKDHFKNIMFDITAEIRESTVTDNSTNETYVALTSIKAGHSLDIEAYSARPEVPAGQLKSRDEKPIDLHFIPFYYRANRGGTGHMRVGLRRKA